MREEYRGLEGWRQHFEKSRDPGDLLTALQKVMERELPLPEWLYLEIEKILLENRRERPGRGKRSLEERDIQNTVDLMRHLTVENLLRNGTPYLEVWEAASAELEGTGFSGSADTIRRSHLNLHKRILAQLSYDPELQSRMATLIDDNKARKHV